MNEALPKLLRAIADAEQARAVGHDVILNAAAAEIEASRKSSCWRCHKPRVLEVVEQVGWLCRKCRDEIHT